MPDYSKMNVTSLKEIIENTETSCESLNQIFATCESLLEHDIYLVLSLVKHYNVDSNLLEKIFEKHQRECIDLFIILHNNVSIKLLNTIFAKYRDKFNPEICRAIALNVNVTPELLEAIYLLHEKHKDKYNLDLDTITNIIQNPNVSNKLIKLILTEYKDEFKTSYFDAIVSNQNTSDVLLNIILGYTSEFDRDPSLLLRIVQHHNATAEIFDIILKKYASQCNQDKTLLYYIVWHHNATSEVLDTILKNYASRCNKDAILLNDIGMHKNVTPEFLIRILQSKNFASLTVNSKKIIADAIFSNKSHLSSWNFNLLEELKSISLLINKFIVEQIKRNASYLLQSINNVVFPFIGCHTNSSFKNGGLEDILKLDWFREKRYHIDKLPEKILILNQETNDLEEKSIEQIYQETISSLSQRRKKIT